jgi:transposase
MKVVDGWGNLGEGVLRIETANRTRAFQPVRKFGLGAVTEQRTVSHGDMANTQGRLIGSGAFRGTHQKECVMDVVNPRCCGIDVHKASVCACISIKEGNQSRKEKRRFDTTTAQLRELAAGLGEWKITRVAMEATGVYWKPVWNVLEEGFELLLVNPQHLKSIPGKKTDFKDGERIADLLQHGLLRGSFVPPRPIRELRDLTRMRATLAQERSSVISRIEKTLEDPNLKLGVVASDVVGVSGRAILNAIVRGETDAAQLAEMAKGTLRNKIPQLRLALEGNITEHHRFLLGQWLEMLDFIERQMRTLERQIEDKSHPFEALLQTWMQVPGLRRINAYSLLAEIGAEMQQFPTAAHLASWAAVCPGNRESAGKQASGRTCPGNPWLRRTLCEAAWAASRTKNSYFRALYQRKVRTRGKNRALIAVAHSLLVTVYSFTTAGQPYRDLGLDYFDRLNRQHLERSLVKRLEKLGNHVTLEPTHPAV